MTASSRRAVIAALGLTQILAWGSSVYLLAVLAGPIAADTGWPLAGVVGGISAGLIVAGLVSPRVGRTIGRRGGRVVLALSAVLLAAGLAILGVAPSLPVFLAGWIVLGVGMGCGLYDAAFATLGGIYGEEARRAITALTLWGGFASTVCWPLSAVMVEQVGWRGTCLGYAALQLGVSLPLLLLALPHGPAPVPRDAPESSAPARLAGAERRAFLLMAGVATLGGAVTGAVSVHLLALLQARGLSLAEAVALGTLIGPAQVAARVVEMAGRGRHHPTWTLLAAIGLMAVGLMLLWAGFAVVALALILYGAGNGVYSIARGTLPLAVFGAARYPALVGRLAMPSLLAQAVAPFPAAFILEGRGAGALLAGLAGLAAVNVLLVLALWRPARDASASRR